jgi:CDP-diacylglycerol pyrophosphatase
MPDDENTGEFGRREFMKFSGGVGAAAVAGAAAPSVVKGLASRVATTTDCGDPNSKDELWVAAKDCVGKTAGSGDCLAPSKIGKYVVLPGARGRKPGNHNELLVPTERVRGIECSKLWGASTPDLKGEFYWYHAWEEAESGIASVKVGSGDVLALGVNSKKARERDQLHIHMAEMKSAYLDDLDTAYSMKNVATDPKNWFDKQYLVKLNNRSYRVLSVPRLNAIEYDPFVMLSDRYGGGTRASKEMVLQTLVVACSAKNKVFYVLNSNSDTGSRPVSGGTDTCDSSPSPGLLYYG